MPNKRFGNKRRNADYMENPEYKGSVVRNKEDSSVDTLISSKALKGLPKSTYTFKADPYTASNAPSAPYAVLASFNQNVGGNYRGVQNLDGGNVQQYANSLFSVFLNYYDYMSMELKLNYRYVPSRMSPDWEQLDGRYPGKKMIDTMLEAISEATSTLGSTTFHNLEINNYAVSTSMPMGSATASERTVVDEDGNTVGQVNMYTNVVHVLYALSRFYQLYWLTQAHIINWHNAFRLKMGTLIRSAYNREMSILNSFFGYLKKKSFLCLLDGLCLSLPGEYIDTEFMVQTNMVSLIPSRRSNSITDPTLELLTTYDVPEDFALYYKVEDGKYLKIFDLDSLKFYSGNYNMPAEQESLPPKNIFEVCRDFVKMMSAEDTAKWARDLYTRFGGTITESSANAVSQRFNTIKYMIDIMTAANTSFKIWVTDLRECFDTLTRAGLMNWTKGFRPSITKDTDATEKQNLLVDNIYQVAMSGANELSFSNETKRWLTFSMWNMYKGIPSYDVMSGGAFISFSLKTIIPGIDEDYLIDYLPIGLVPYEYNGTRSPICYACNRKGHQVIVQAQSVTLGSNVVLKRLAPLPSQQSKTIRQPVVTYSTSDNESIKNKSTLLKTLTQIFGHCIVDNVFTLDSDILAIYQIEIEDISNASIAYARTYSPFRGTADAGIPSFGFMT